MKIYEGREKREQEEYDREKNRLEQQQKALDRLSDSKLSDEEKFKRPDDIDADVWLDMRAKTLAADEATRKAVTEKAIQARYNGLSKFEASGGDPNVAGQLFDEIAADGLTSRVGTGPDGSIKVFRGKVNESGEWESASAEPMATFKNKDEMREALYKASDPKTLIPHMLKQHISAEEAAREVDTYEKKKKVDQKYEDPKIEKSTEEWVDDMGVTHKTNRFFKHKGGKMVELPQERAEGTGGLDWFFKRFGNSVGK